MILSIGNNFSDPKDFGGPDKATEAIFCKIRSASCQFPFRYENANHSSCIQRGENFWCPTKVNDDLEPIKGFWGKCNVAEGKTNCDPNWTPPPDPEAEPEAEIKTKGINCSKKYFLISINLIRINTVYDNCNIISF